MSMLISELEEDYYFWAEFDRGRAKSTILKYRDCIRNFRENFGDLNVRKIKIEHFEEIKRIYFGKGCGRARVASIIYSMKSFLRYCREVRGYRALESGKIKPPAQERYREVVALTREEIAVIMEKIKMMNVWKGKKRQRNVNLHGLRWKCLLEVLWSSGMRISEALSLNRDTIDFGAREAIITGKGNKDRRVFFSEKAIALIREYLAARHDDHEALFVTHCEARRWGFSAAQNYLERWRADLNMQKHVTFHTMRRSFASLIFYEKDILAASKLLGHSDIETTRRHYISVDWEKLKEIHHQAVDK